MIIKNHKTFASGAKKTISNTSRWNGYMAHSMTDVKRDNAGRIRRDDGKNDSNDCSHVYFSFGYNFFYKI